MTRLLAALAAVAMVVGALAVRDRIDDDDDGGGAGDNRLVCATELAAVCGADAAIEPAGATADRLATGQDLDVDGWLAAGPWAAMTNDARRRAGVRGALDVGEPVGATRVGVVVWKDRADVMRRRCGGDLSWRCLGDAALAGQWAALGGQDAWGPVKLAIGDPTSDSAGLAALGGATSAFLGGTSYASGDLDGNDEYRRWLAGIVNAAVDSSLDAMLTAGPAVADALVGFEAILRPVVEQSARRNDVELVYPSPVVTVPVFPAGDIEVDALDERLRDAGWRAPAAPQGLPTAGVLDYLRGLWREAAR